MSCSADYIMACIGHEICGKMSVDVANFENDVTFGSWDRRNDGELTVMQAVVL